MTIWPKQLCSPSILTFFSIASLIDSSRPDCTLTTYQCRFVGTGGSAGASTAAGAGSVCAGVSSGSGVADAMVGTSGGGAGGVPIGGWSVVGLSVVIGDLPFGGFLLLRLLLARIVEQHLYVR